MIFGLFMLLIISLVVLSMFFKFVKKGGDSMGGTSEAYAKEAAIEEAKAQCTALCEGIKDLATELEFCSRMYKVDWDKDGRVEGKANYGQWWFCEQKIPCFVLVENCKGRYDGNRCRRDLAEYQEHNYIKFLNDIDGLNPDTGNDGMINVPQDTVTAYEDGCELYYSEVNINAVNPEGIKTRYNWKQRYCFNLTAEDARDPAYICTAPE